MKRYEAAELFGITVLDLEERWSDDEKNELIKKAGRPLFFYDIRHGDENDELWVQVKDLVVVNYWTTILSKDPIEVPRNIDEDDWSYIGEDMSIDEYLEAKSFRELFFDYAAEVNEKAGREVMSDDETESFLADAEIMPLVHVPYMIESDEKTAGFIFIGKYPECKEYADVFIEHAYVCPEYRGKHLMEEKLKELTKKMPGTWCAVILKEDDKAHEFWNKTFKELGYSPVTSPDIRKRFDWDEVDFITFRKGE